MHQYPFAVDGPRVFYVSIFGRGPENARACAMELYEGLTDP